MGEAWFVHELGATGFHPKSRTPGASYDGVGVPGLDQDPVCRV